MRTKNKVSPQPYYFYYSEDKGIARYSGIVTLVTKYAYVLVCNKVIDRLINAFGHDKSSHFTSEVFRVFIHDDFIHISSLYNVLDVYATFKINESGVVTIIKFRVVDDNEENQNEN